MAMEFKDVVLECAMNKDFVKSFDRLSGTNVWRVVAQDTRKPIEIMIDNATGYDKVLDVKAHEDMQKFFDFVFECVWCRLPKEAFVCQK
jgi:hypothetical protein